MVFSKFISKFADSLFFLYLCRVIVFRLFVAEKQYVKLIL